MVAKEWCDIELCVGRGPSADSGAQGALTKGRVADEILGAAKMLSR